MRHKILHIHSDYPDGREGYPFTTAVANLISAAEVDDHYVVSINRTSNPFKVSCREFDQGISLIYWCIPLSFLYVLGLWLTSVWINKKVRNVKFDLVHAHKLTTEGVIGEFIARRSKRPLLVSLRGGTDLHNIDRFKVFSAIFRRVANRAECVLLVSPWAKNKVETQLTVKFKNSIELPNICTLPNIAIKQELSVESRYFTVLSFHQYKRKGIENVLAAFVELSRQGHQYGLDIYGGGSDEIKDILERLIVKFGLQDKILMKGKIPHSELLRKMPAYRGLILPAVNETFGMVYIEAIASGVPIIYHKNTGVDGYFDESIGVAVSSQKVEELAAAIKRLSDDRDYYLKGITEYQSSGKLNKFTRCGVSKVYSDAIEEVINARN